MSAKLVYFITIIVSTTAAPTTLIPTNHTIIPITNASGFELCTKLNLAGCGTNTINDLIRGYVDGQIQGLGYNYSLPLDPCDFNTINMSWILSLADLSLLSIVTADQVLTEMPCEIYIQMPSDFLADKDLTAITTDAYWFGHNGHCIYNASNILDCSDPNRTIANYTSKEFECFYPFVPSNYKTPIAELYEAGFEKCGVSCDYYPYTSDIKQLDDFNYAASMISLFFGIGYFINVIFEFSKALKGKTSLWQLPLTFDIPIIIAVWMMILTITLVIPSWAGKEYFGCEIGTRAMVQDPLSETNIHCYIVGQFTMLCMSSIYLYCSLLAFSIWRSLAAPFKPLFGIHKIWYHLGLNIVVLGYYISAMVEDVFGAINVVGICGPNITGDTGTRYLFVPLVFDLTTFVIFTSLTIFKLWHHFQHQQKHSAAEKAIANLAIRMVIYSVFVAASLICFLYISSSFVVDGDEWSQRIDDNIRCHVENELFGEEKECILELNISDNVYFMQGLVVLLVSIASFILSCSNARFTDYDKMRKRARIGTASTIKKFKSMGTIGSISSVDKSRSKSSGNKKSNDKEELESVLQSQTSLNTPTVDINNRPQHIAQISSMDGDGSIQLTTLSTPIPDHDRVKLRDISENENSENE